MANSDQAKAAADRSGRPSWRVALAVFMRVVALFLIVAGVADWAYVLGAVDVGGVPYLDQRVPVRNAIAVFAATNLVAAIGLWFGAAWGAAFWVIVSVSRIVLHTVFADVHGATPVASAVEAVLIVLYVALWVLARREARIEERLSRQRRRQTQNTN